jgi:hypothetical protein
MPPVRRLTAILAAGFGLELHGSIQLVRDDLDVSILLNMITSQISLTEIPVIEAAVGSPTHTAWLIFLG